MDTIYESANNFLKIIDKKYRFVISHKRKTKEIVLDFQSSDYRHATGLHHITDIAIERNPIKLINAIIKEPRAVTDITLNKSKKYKEESPYTGSVECRVSDIRFLESCLDSSDFIRIYQIQKFGSLIGADYFIETHCKEINSDVYIFIRKREESDYYVVVSFFRKKVSFNGIPLYWMLKEKITNNQIFELYKHPNYKTKDFT